MELVKVLVRSSILISAALAFVHATAQDSKEDLKPSVNQAKQIVLAEGRLNSEQIAFLLTGKKVDGKLLHGNFPDPRFDFRTGGRFYASNATGAGYWRITSAPDGDLLVLDVPSWPNSLSSSQVWYKKMEDGRERIRFGRWFEGYAVN